MLKEGLLDRARIECLLRLAKIFEAEADENYRVHRKVIDSILGPI
jgi:hypothetical protein